MVESQTIRFTETARSVANRARALELTVPVFRSPPKIVGLTRTVRRRSDGEAVVAVAYKGRPWPAVVSDMIEGLIVVNELGGVQAGRVRDDLWDDLAPSLSAAA